jgi:hypothetical protein
MDYYCESDVPQLSVELTYRFCTSFNILPDREWSKFLSRCEKTRSF